MREGAGEEYRRQDAEVRRERGKGTEIGDWLFVIRRKEGEDTYPRKGTNSHEMGVNAKGGKGEEVCQQIARIYTDEELARGERRKEKRLNRREHLPA